MSQQYNNQNKGVLFANKKRQSDNHPTHTGNINIDGKEFWLNAWVKDGPNGKYFSMSVKPKEQQQSAPAQQKAAPPPAQAEVFDEDIPF